MIGTLIDMLTYCRPHLSATEREFIARYVASIPGIEQDPHGNFTIAIGTSRILWSAHLDTVHHADGRQTLRVDPAGTIMLSKRARRLSSCLGADDTAGVFVLCQMIKRGIPGRYVFHRGEERGGIGSSALVRQWPNWTIDAAIALDRRGTSDVITYQMSSRCASIAFADSMISELSRVTNGRLKYNHARGSYTDTAEYVDRIGECTNLSIGYQHEHTAGETLNSAHVLTMLDALCKLDPTRLTYRRAPGEDVETRLNIRRSYAGIEWYKRDTTPLIDRADRVCEYCTAPYEELFSFADDPSRFCGFRCEMDASRDRRVYLHEYGEVLRALRRVN
jgi:hypothetical protein